MNRAAIGATTFGLLMAVAAASAAAPKAGPELTRAAQGRAVALRACAACHAVDPGETSPNPAAPAFPSSQMRHTAGLEGRVAALTQTGHYDMPPVRLSAEDLADLMAYFRALEDR